MRTFIVCIYVPVAEHYDAIEVQACNFTDAIDIARGRVPEGAQCIGIVDQRWIEQNNLNMAKLTSEIQALLDKFETE